MPDWSYRTLFRPLLFSLPARTARDLSLGMLGRLARLPLGSAVIDFLGHMRADPRLARSYNGLELASPLGLGPHLDPQAVAAAALARFGFGFVEIGPILLTENSRQSAVKRDNKVAAFYYPPDSHGLTLPAALQRLKPLQNLPTPLWARLSLPTAAALAPCADAMRELAPHVAAFVLAVPGSGSADLHREHLTNLLTAIAGLSHVPPLLISIPAALAPEHARATVAAALDMPIAGVIVDGQLPVADGGYIVGAPAATAALEQVANLRQEFPALVIVASGGIHDPHQAVQFLAAGANLLQVDTGLVFAGPGLPKRINDAILFAQESNPHTASPPQPAGRLTEMAWLWALLLGSAMFFGGILAWAIAATYVVLPYDEAFLGMTRAELQQINPRLLDFMAHDRITLAGTMVAIGVFYILLALYGIRRGLHWAWVTVLTSAFAGFGSFFLFLGFGYFDPFHAFVTAVLFQLLLLAMHGRLAPLPVPQSPNLSDDLAWRLAQWGQLLFIAHGVALLAAGAAICTVGSTSVFVHEDLDFMQTTAEALRAANPRLVPVVAHDRASFGGMLLSCGIAQLLSALWGFRRGEHWLWWMFLLTGMIGYLSTLAVHLGVGYTNLLHLAPVFAGIGSLWLALGLSCSYLCGANPNHLARWQNLLGLLARRGSR